MIADNKNAYSSPYRGKCDSLKSINEVDIDISALMQEFPPAFDGEPVKRVFPVRSQLTWFRLKNDKGDIATEIIKDDEFMAIVKATVIVDSEKVANAHGSADATNDGVNGFKLIETAESRAISRALDFAGYGCQLDLKTFDESLPNFPAASLGEGPVGNGNVQFPNEAPAAPQPGTVKGKKKVDANAASGIVDIKDLEGPTDPPSDKPKTTRKKKNSEGEQAPTASAPGTVSGDGAVQSETSDKPGTADGSTKDASEMSQQAAETVEGNAGEETDAEPGAASEGPQAASEDNAAAGDTQGSSETDNISGEPAAEPTTEAPAKPLVETPADSGKTAEQLVLEHIAMVIGSDLPKPAFDAQFFGSGQDTDQPFDESSIDPSGMFNNPTAGNNGAGKETKINNLELQIAISFLQANPGVINSLNYPATKGTFVGKTFGDILGGDAKIAEMAIASCKKLYAGKDVPSYAAALILAANAEEGGEK